MATLTQPAADVSQQLLNFPQRVLPVDLSGNGVNWNLDNITLLASTAYASNGAATGTDQTNYNARGVMLYITTGSFGSGASAITVSIQGKDPVSGNYFTLATTASLSASSTSLLILYPGATASSCISAPLPHTWRVIAQASAWGTGGSTIGVACSLIV
jgi:hypothetical protein